MGHKVHYSSNVYKQITQNIDNFYNLWKLLEGALSIDFEIRDDTNEEIENLKEKYDKLIELDNQKDKEIKEIKNTVKYMSKFLLMLDESFKEAIDSEYIPKIDDGIVVSEEEVRDFRERVRNLFKKE